MIRYTVFDITKLKDCSGEYAIYQTDDGRLWWGGDTDPDSSNAWSRGISLQDLGKQRYMPEDRSFNIEMTMEVLHDGELIYKEMLGVSQN